MAGAVALGVMATGCTDGTQGDPPLQQVALDGPDHAVARVPGGWLVVRQGNLVRVDEDGSTPSPELPTPKPPLRQLIDTYVNPDGTAVAVGRRGMEDDVSWSRFDGRRWSSPQEWAADTPNAIVNGSGEHVVVALGGSAPDGVDATPLAGLAISDDGGATWRQVDVPPDLVEALSVAVTKDGTAFVTVGIGPWLRVRPGGEATVMRSLHPIVATAVGNRVYVRDNPTGDRSAERVLVSSDHGRSWLPVRPPD